MRNKVFAAGLALALFLGVGSVQASSWTVDPEASALRFTGTQTQNAFQGQFRRFSAEIALDPDDLSGAAISVVVDTGSFASGSPDRDTDALSVDWFNTSAFPQAVFTSTEVVHLEGENYLARGNLAIKGVERPLDLPFTLRIEGDGAVAEGAVAFNRLDFGVGVNGEYEDDSFVGHEVTVSFRIAASRAD